MKTSLDHLPARKQRTLECIVDILFEEFDDMETLVTQRHKKRGRILKIILYGSHARGDWVEDRVSGYFSDYDLLIIVNQKRLAEGADCWIKAEDRLLRGGLPLRSIPQFIVHTLEEVSDKLAQGAYFFTDIAKEGIALYELKGHKLAEPKPLDEAQAKEMSEKYLEQELNRARDNFKTFQFNLAEGMLNNAAFMLHQTVEKLYTAFLLSQTLYSPAGHNIKFLRSRAEDIDEALREVWPHDTRRDRATFELLKRAYVEARYSEHYEIGKEQLEWLSERAEHLQELVAARGMRFGDDK